MDLSGRPVQNERGISLVVALLILTILSLLAMVLMMSLSTDTKLTAHNINEASALNVAEAGIAEATSRIADGTINLAGNPRATALIFNTVAGSVPVVGVDSTAFPTAQPAGAWLAYSTPNKSPDVLTVSYKTNTARTQIYKYDPTKNPPVQTASGTTIYVIRSSGRTGQVVRRVATEVVQKPLLLNIRSAIAADVHVKFTGNANTCGYNHRFDTPDGTGDNGRNGAGGCNENAGLQHWETGGGDKTGIWSTDVINMNGGAQASGTPAEQQNQVGFYAGPWEALGMTQPEFYSWVGNRIGAEPADPNGIYYLDDNGTTQDASGNFAFNGGDGSGFLYVDGDLTLNSNFTYRGLIYVEGDLKLNGDAWILGGLIVKGEATLKQNGGSTVLFSYDSIQQNIAKFAGKFATLSWREL